MKRILLLMLSIAALQVTAEPIKRKPVHTRPAEHKIPSDVMQQQYARSSAKTTAAMKRMIANSYSANGMKADSNHYYYSSGRGSVNGLPESYFSTYTMTSYKQNVDIEFDSAINWHDYGTGFDRSATTIQVYNSQGKVITVDNISNYIRLKYDGLYDNNGTLTRITISDTFGGSGLIPKSYMYIIYDGQGRRIMDSTMDAIKNIQIGRRTYTYDSNNDLVEFASYSYKNNMWNLSYRDKFTYDNQRRKITEYCEGDYGNGFMMQQRDSFGYTGTAVAPTYHSIDLWDDNNALWDPYEILTYTLNGNNLPDTYIIYRHITAWDTIERDVYTYDGNGLLLKSNGYLYTGNGQFSNTPYDQSNLYYEEYYPQGITGYHKQEQLLVVYPNPTQSILTLEHSNTTTSITIVDITGRLVYEQATTGQRTQMNVYSLPQGDYIISAWDANSNQMQQSKFTRQ